MKQSCRCRKCVAKRLLDLGWKETSTGWANFEGATFLPIKRNVAPKARVVTCSKK